MSKTTTPHDALFKAAFGRADIARSELEFILPRAVRLQLDLSTLSVLPGSFVDEELRQTHSDLLYQVRTVSGAPALVLVLAEHESTFDPTMPLRLLEYGVRVWRRWLVDHGGSKLPLLLSVVLHHGEENWIARPELASMLDADPDATQAMRAHTPHFEFVIDDLTPLSLDAIAGRTLHVLGRLVQIAFWTARSSQRFDAAAPLMQELAKTTKRDASTRALLTQLYVYLLRVLRDADAEAVYNKLLEIAGPQGREDVMTAAEQLIDQGRLEGLLKGRLEALRGAIVTALQVRGMTPSDSTRSRLEGCTDPTLLQRWFEHALKANQEAEIFAS